MTCGTENFMRSRLFLRFVSLAFVLVAPLDLVGAAQNVSSLEPAFSSEAIHLAQCRQSAAGVESTPSGAQVLNALGLKTGGGVWSAGRVSDGKETVFRYILTLTQPTEIGSFNLSAPEWDGVSTRTVSFLKNEAVAPDSGKEGDWEELHPSGATAFYTLPPAFKTRAFRITEIRTNGVSSLEAIRFFKCRLHDIAPEATGIGERGPFCSAPSALLKGGVWQNAALDPDPTNKATRILRPTVSDVAPSWFILNWDQPRTLSGIFLRTNAVQYKLFAYIGDARTNPALAGSDDWTRISFSSTGDVTRQNEKTVPFSRWIAFEPTKTLALKIVVLECVPKGTPVLSLNTFNALTDLGDAPVPPAKRDDVPAYQFDYALTQSGETALAINAPDGRRVRTVFAQIPLTEGKQSGAWDLKDDNGRTVQPGAYQWEAINAPPIELHYAMTVTPNVEARSPERTPWMQEISGPHSWMADHAMATTCTTLGDKVYFGAPGVEGGTAFIECDLHGVKQWGKVNFGAWTGVGRLTADNGAAPADAAVLILAGNTVFRMNPVTHEIKELCPANTPQRKGWVQSIAARDGKLYLARSSPVPFIDNAVTDGQVDLEHCLPLYPKEIRGNFRTVPNPRVDFLRVLRLTGTPPGQAEAPTDRPQQHWPIFLESTQGLGRKQFVLVSFKEPVAIGSLVFPHPGGKLNLRFSVLKPQVTLPPSISREADWIPFEQNGKPGNWDCVAAPPNTLTRALRITFAQPGDDLDDMLDTPADPAAKPSSKPGTEDLFAAPSDKKDDAPGKRGWTGRLEGMKILRRRLQNIFAEAKVRVNSGSVSPDGIWDAKRTESVTPESPGIYVMEWDTPKIVCGLAFKEIDGAKTEIDVWTGADGPIPLEGGEGWKKIATYEQARRLYYEPDFNRNDCARYMDGYVNFEKEQTTRAVRLRVVSQWLDNEGYPHGLRKDMGGQTLDPRRCRIFGVAVLANLGGEVPLDTRAYQGLDIIDAKSGRLNETLACDPGYSLAINAAGEVCTLRDFGIQRIDSKTGNATAIVEGLKSPERLTTDSAGNYYVYCGHEGGSVIRVFDKEGKPVREIGHAGGIQPGSWDPQRMSNVNEICVDNAGNLWVMDTDDQPRRTIQFKTDGRFVQELLGNAHYGGGGTLNRYDLTRGYLGRVEFEIDYEKRVSHVRGILAEQIYGDDLLATRIKNRLYLTSTPMSHRAEQPFGTVYVYDEAKRMARLAAAFGDAAAFQPMYQPEIIAAMQGKTPKQFRFIWTDRNGDGKVQSAEVHLEPKPVGANIFIGRFDEELGCASEKSLYAVKEFLEDGTPVYVRNELPAGGLLRMNGGKIFSINGQSPTSRGLENAVYTSAGQRQWSYPVEHPSVSGLWLPPWHAGYVSNQFAIIGHETARAGDLGEYVVIHANNGQWNIWTADGFLAGHVLYHALDRRAKGFGPASGAPGTRMDPLTGGQEMFHGFFTQSEKDGRAYIVAGGNYMSIMEVKGMEKFKRSRGEIRVTPEDIQRVHARESEQTRREIVSSVPVIECRRASALPRIDGKYDKDEWPEPSAKIDDVTFTMTYDAQNLYLCFTGSGLGVLKNSGTEFQRYFKTGACLDFQIGTDSKADPVRTQPGAGDVRVLMTFAQNKPRVILYQPVSAGARPEEAWETFTAVAGKTHFDRVVVLDGAKLATTTGEFGTCVEAAIPIKDLRLKVTPGLRLKMDWGVLFSRDGNKVDVRSYWTNTTANGTSDESLEARLEPSLWGYVEFPGGAPGKKNQPAIDGDEKKGGDILDILERK